MIIHIYLNESERTLELMGLRALSSVDAEAASVCVHGVDPADDVSGLTLTLYRSDRRDVAVTSWDGWTRVDGHPSSIRSSAPVGFSSDAVAEWMEDAGRGDTEAWAVLGSPERLYAACAVPFVIA